MSRVKWKEAFYNEEPAIIDDTSSQDSVRIRKDIEYVQGDGQFIESHWRCLEQKIPTSDWIYYQKLMNHDDALEIISGAIAEIAETIGGN